MSTEGRPMRYIKKLSMAVSPKDWNRVKKSHHTIGPKYIDHTEHLAKYPAPDSFKNMLGTGEENNSSHKNVSGIRRKMVHEVPVGEDTDTFMSKAYHAAPESANRSWVRYPISGWATMTTKALFDAVGLGDSVEDVSTHEHEGVPLTVHKFGKGYDTVHDILNESAQRGYVRQSIDPDKVHKIAALDFLTGNNDRHNLNMMVGNNDNVDERGYNPIMAIDHERNFQYAKPVKYVREVRHNPMMSSNVDNTDRPQDYIKYTALKPLARTGGNNDSLGFREWWTEVSPKIETTFSENLSLIKDQTLREHLRRNFMQRKMLIDKWATPGTEHNYEQVDLFDPDFPGAVRLISKPRAAPETIEKILASLPANDVTKAIDVLAATSSKKKAYSTQEKLMDAFEKMLDKVPLELAKIYEHCKVHHLMMNGQLLTYTITKHIVDTGNKVAAQTLLDYDNHTGKILPFWADQLEKLAQGGKNETTLQNVAE